MTGQENSNYDEEEEEEAAELDTSRFEVLRAERDPELLLDGRKHPKGWKILTPTEKLDYIATRYLAEDRSGITSHNALKETGILSASQYERRRAREVYSNYGSLDDIKPKEGTFHRVHARDLRGLKESIEYAEPESTGPEPAGPGAESAEPAGESE